MVLPPPSEKFPAQHTCWCLWLGYIDLREVKWFGGRWFCPCHPFSTFHHRTAGIFMHGSRCARCRCRLSGLRLHRFISSARPGEKLRTVCTSTDLNCRCFEDETIDGRNVWEDCCCSATASLRDSIKRSSFQLGSAAPSAPASTLGKPLRMQHGCHCRWHNVLPSGILRHHVRSHHSVHRSAVPCSVTCHVQSLTLVTSKRIWDVGRDWDTEVSTTTWK